MGNINAQEELGPQSFTVTAYNQWHWYHPRMLQESYPPPTPRIHQCFRISQTQRNTSRDFIIPRVVPICSLILQSKLMNYRISNTRCCNRQRDRLGRTVSPRGCVEEQPHGCCPPSVARTIHCCPPSVARPIHQQY